MAKKKIRVAICYDFDGTLSPGNMQEYGFFPGLKGQGKNFWQEASSLAKESHADPILAYMRLMVLRANEGNLLITRKAFRDYGKSVKLYEGVNDWFKRINDYGKLKGLAIEHYIVSSGLKEMVEGSSVGKEFEKIYACSFIYDQHDVAKWPAVAVNYTTKTQFLFRINKGVEDDNDNKTINAFIPDSERPIPFSRMIYIGDGATDIPCMKLVKDKGGTSIAVYPPKTQKKHKEAEKLITDQRVNYISNADYTDGSRLDDIIKAVLDKIASEAKLQIFVTRKDDEPQICEACAQKIKIKAPAPLIHEEETK